MQTKKCPRCQETKSLSEFGESKAHPGVYDAWCRECRRVYNQAYQHSYQKTYRKKSCPKCGSLTGIDASYCQKCRSQEKQERKKVIGVRETARIFRELFDPEPICSRCEVTVKRKSKGLCSKCYYENQSQEARQKRSESLKQLWQGGHYKDTAVGENFRAMHQERNAPKIAAQALVDVALLLIFSKVKEQCRFCKSDKWPHELHKQTHLCKECGRKLREERKWLFAHEQKRCSKCLEIKSLADFSRHKAHGLYSSCKTCEKEGYKYHPRKVESFIPDKTKICGKCGEEKPYSEFYKDSHREDGYRYQCKDCVRVYDAACKEQRHENYLGLKERKNRCPECGAAISPWIHHGEQRCPECATKKRHGEGRPQPLLAEHYHLAKDLLGKSKELGTALERNLAQALDELGLNHVTRQHLPDCPYVYDEYVPGLNLLIEADGEYWHFSEWAQERGIPENDVQKDQWAVDNGYHIIRVRERDSEFKGMKACLAEQLFEQLGF